MSTLLRERLCMTISAGDDAGSSYNETCIDKEPVSNRRADL